mgnify:CR=1 FL=1
MGIRHRIAWLGLAGMVMMAAGGCDQLSQKSTAPNASDSQSAASNPGGGQPGMLVVPTQELAAKVNQASVSTTDVELATLEVRRYVEATQQTWQPLPAQELADALDLTDVLGNLLDAELKAQDARGRGLDAKTDVRRRLAYLQRGFYAQEWDRWQRDRAVPKEEEIHQFYEQNKLGFTDPERLRARQVVAETLTEAEAVRTKAVEGADFAQLSRDFSVGAGNDQGGDIGWHLRTFDRDRLRFMGAEVTEEVIFPQLEPVAFALETGQISQPVKGPDGRYYVVKLEERKPSRQQTELEVHDAIKDLLTIQAMQRQLEELRKKAQIERFPERLQDVKQ